MYVYGTIREFRTPQFTVIVDALEDGDIDLSWDDTGETREGLESGKFIAFCARTRVFFKGVEIASDYLGNCIYESIDAFMDHRQCGQQNRELAAKGETGRCGSYFHQMIRESIKQARASIQHMQSVHVRA